MKFSFDSADEEAGEVGATDDDDDADNPDIKVESSQRQSLTHRLSSLYETLISKAAPKKSDRSGASGTSIGIGNAAADVEAKVETVIINWMAFYYRQYQNDAGFFMLHECIGRSHRLR